MLAEENIQYYNVFKLYIRKNLELKDDTLIE